MRVRYLWLAASQAWANVCWHRYAWSVGTGVGRVRFRIWHMPESVTGPFLPRQSAELTGEQRPAIVASLD